MDELEPRLDALIAAARDGHEPDAEAQARVRLALTKALAQPVTEPRSAHDPHKPLEPAHAAAAHGLGATARWLLLVSGVTVAVATVAYQQQLQSSRARRTAQANVPVRPRAPAPAPPAPAEPPAPTSPAPAPEPLAIDTPAPAQPRVATREPSDVVPRPARARTPRGRPSQPRAIAPQVPAEPLPSELGLIRDATHALNAGDAMAALQVLAEHARVYPNGMLEQERQGLRVLALCAAGQIEQGLIERDRFLLAAPHSPLTARVRTACNRGPR